MTNDEGRNQNTFVLRRSSFIPQTMSRRQDRVGEQIHRAISELLVFQTQDPRLANITVTRAEVTGDLRMATIYITVDGTTHSVTEALEGLQHAPGYLRRGLAQRLQLRFAPELRFQVDERSATEARVQDLIDQLYQRPTRNE